MIVVTGLSKSGKTKTIESSRPALPAFCLIKASTLLIEAGRKIRELTHSEAAENQRILLDILLQAFAEHKCILDGHGLIETKEGAYLVPPWFFQSLPIDGIVQIIVDTATLAARRAGTELEQRPEMLFEFQDLEFRHCTEQAGKLGLPFQRISSGDRQSLIKFVTHADLGR